MLTFADKRAYLSDSLQLTPGPLAESIDADVDRAAQAAEGLWRRDRAVWSSDAATQRKTAAKPDRSENGIELTLSAAAREQLQNPETILRLIRPGDYAALLAYVGPDRALAAELASLRRAIRDRTKAATVFGYGPRYLHSTGQLHEGGPNTGVFVVITATPQEDLPIPGEPFSFGTLELAQGRGDFASLDAAGRRALHAHLAAPAPALVHQLTDALLQRIETA